MNYITINGVQYPHPIDFAMQKTPNIVSTIKTMSGKSISDVNGWKYDDVQLKWEWISETVLRSLLSATADGEIFTFGFCDPETGALKTVNAYRTSSTCMETRSLDTSGNAVWKNIQIEFSFPDCYQE